MDWISRRETILTRSQHSCAPAEVTVAIHQLPLRCYFAAEPTPSLKSPDEKTALCLACDDFYGETTSEVRAAKVEIVRLLLASAAPDQEYDAAAVKAMINQFHEGLEVLLSARRESGERIVDVNHFVPYDGNPRPTFLQYTAMMSFFPDPRLWLSILLRHGADPNKRGEDGRNPLIEICSIECDYELHRFEEAAQCLLAGGADPNVTDNDGRSAVHHAAANASGIGLAPILKHGCDVNARSNKGWTALQYAVEAKNRRTAEMLLRHAADINAQDPSTGSTALHIAASDGSPDSKMLHLLCSFGANVETRDSNGQTPIELLERNTDWKRRPSNKAMIEQMRQGSLNTTDAGSMAD
ncbi:hypothetical protein PINS_up020362 [Pythium insidiosum]|nr:hypothetical protein PINS_up020362 [Pythium insidiosum]